MKRGTRKKVLVKKTTSHCALPECGQQFTKKSHNNKYCSPEHARIATNRKILARYYDKKRKVSGKRVCKAEGCGAILSIYNRDEYCAPCSERLGYA